MHARVYLRPVCDLEILIEGSAGHINVMRLRMILNLHFFFPSADNTVNQYHVDVISDESDSTRNNYHD